MSFFVVDYIMLLSRARRRRDFDDPSSIHVKCTRMSPWDPLSLTRTVRRPTQQYQDVLSKSTHEESCDALLGLIFFLWRIDQLFFRLLDCLYLHPSIPTLLLEAPCIPLSKHRVLYRACVPPSTHLRLSIGILLEGRMCIK